MVARVLKINMTLVASILIMVIPTVVVVMIGWKSAGTLAMLAAMAGLFSAAGLRWRGLIPMTLVSGLGIFAGTLASDNPVASAAVMLGSGAILGGVNKWGLSVWNFMFPVLVASVIAEPPKVVTGVEFNALITALIGMGCILVGGLLTMLVVKKAVQQTVPAYPLKVNVVYAVNFAILLAAAGYVASVMKSELPGMWLALSIVVILIRPYQGETTIKALQRAGGTILGFLLAIGISASLMPTSLYYVIAFAFLEIAVLMRFSLKRPYWEYVMFLTPGVVLLSGSPSQATEAADYRLLATVAAALACLAVLGVERVLFWRGGLTKTVNVTAGE